MKAPAIPIPASTPSNNQYAHKEESSRRSTVVRERPEPPIPSVGPPVATHAADDHALHQNGTAGAIAGLSLVNKHPRPVNGTSGGESGDSLEDDHSHLSTSSTKQHSFDTKSMASVTTFAMDEKESIRPDDSASVRAVDDEDAVSTTGRAPAFTQEPDVVMPALRGMTTRSGGPPINTASRRFQTLTNPPRFGDLEASPGPEADLDDIAPSSPPASTVDQPIASMSAVPPSPDERLLDALASPKDRLSILQIEERILSFLEQPDAQFIDLPPQNSYARLLAHKLADYYGLMHHINEDGMTIRIFRATNFGLPTPLATLARSIPIGSAVVPQGPTAVKIMRRAGFSSRQMSNNASTAPSSSAPSKATSDAGHSEEGLTSPTESTPSRDKSRLTREEREAQYKAARERIFGDFQELSIGENASTGENSASMSRSSSSSGKKKTRRQKTPKDDSFEARSAFVPSYVGLPGMNAQGGYQPAQFVDPAMQNMYDSGQSYYGPQMNYGTTPTQAHPGFDSSMPVSPMTYGADNPGEWAAIQQGSYYGYPQNQVRPGYPQMNPMSPAMNPQYGQYSHGAHPQQNWQAQQYPAAFQAPVNTPAAGGNWPGYQGYGYGQQMPNQQFLGSNPGTPAVATMGNDNSFNRSLFNPQTRSFIPSNNSSRTGSRNSNRKKNTLGNTGQIQGRNIPSVHSPPLGQPSSLLFAPRLQDMAFDPNGDATEESLQKKYGAPANLPKKPPPSQVPSRFDHASLATVRNPSASSVTGRVGGSNGVDGPPVPL